MTADVAAFTAAFATLPRSSGRSAPRRRCDKRVVERLTRECLRDGGRP
jgi:hypothetical protein